MNLLNEASDSRKWIIVNDQSNKNFYVGNENIYNRKVLKFNLCDYKNAYILVKGNITVIGHAVTQVAFKTCTQFTKCINKIDGTTVYDAEDLDLVMSMYNLLEYSSHCYDKTGSSWFHSKDEATNFNADIEDNNNFKSIKFKAKLSGNTKTDGDN